MSTVSAILAALQLLPDLLKLGQEFMVWLKAASGNDPKGYVVRLGEAMKALNEAETDEDRQAAAEEISNAIAGL